MGASQPAMEMLPWVRARLAELRAAPAAPGRDEAGEQEGRRRGTMAAMWRVQQRASRQRASLTDVRSWCLDQLGQPSSLPERDLSADVRGYREGLREALGELRRLEDD